MVLSKVLLGMPCTQRVALVPRADSNFPSGPCFLLPSLHEQFARKQAIISWRLFAVHSSYISGKTGHRSRSILTAFILAGRADLPSEIGSTHGLEVEPRVPTEACVSGIRNLFGTFLVLLGDASLCLFFIEISGFSGSFFVAACLWGHKKVRQMSTCTR